jgi:tetratricopeptide (TPR) repeat protein
MYIKVGKPATWGVKYDIPFKRRSPDGYGDCVKQFTAFALGWIAIVWLKDLGRVSAFAYKRHPAEDKASDYLRRGKFHVRLYGHRYAISDFSRAITIYPNLRSAFIYRGISYLECRAYDKAIEDFTQAINFNSKEARAFSLRGLAYKESGDFKIAKENFEKALKLDPNDEMAKKGLEEMDKENHP